MKITCIKKKIFNQSIRFSKYENLPKTNFLKKIKWIWLDTYDGFPDQKILKLLKRKKKKICLVSPELQGYDKKYIDIIKNILKKEKIIVEAVCTKKPLEWIK